MIVGQPPTREGVQRGVKARADALLRDQFAVAAYPAALADALRGYDHFCDIVLERAAVRAYTAADAILALRATLPPAA